MKAVVGVADLILGVVFLSSAGLVLLGMPGAAGRYEQEPEDLGILAVLLLLSMFLGLAAFLAGLTLLRRRGLGWLSATGAVGFVLASAVVLLILWVLGFVVVHSNASEFRFLAVPAAVLGWSAHVMRRTFRERAAGDVASGGVGVKRAP